MDKRCPYCGGIIENDRCTHCGAMVPAEQQLDPDKAPELPPIVEPSGPRGEYSREEIPWEKQQELGFWTALIETVKEVLTGPSEFFARMPLSGGFGSPLIYAIILGTVGAILGQIWGILLNLIGFSAQGMLGIQPDVGSFAAGTISGIAGAIIGIIIAPIGVAIGSFVWAGIYHLMLMIVGGANEDYEATFRVVAFSQSVQVLQVVPIIGGPVASIWALVLHVKGLSEAHDISQGKALLAILLPIIVCCCFAAGLLIFTGIGAGLMGGMAG
ncbi:hypothetical protein DRQ36_00615 [bacterium]|nr:MAG: hypothetical protein DRQ36_00615 [bacterium]